MSAPQKPRNPLRKIATKTRAHFSSWLGLDNEVRYEVYLSTIRSSNPLNVTYWLELILACGIATLGLVLNSPATIIGAMLISPLMSPILGTGLALATGDVFLGIRAFLNLFFSVVVAVGASYFFVVVLPFKDATPEILARTQPTILDLVVALMCGLAGSIAILKSTRGLTAAIPGVAIAVALMPPICVVGFGLGARKALPQWAEVARGGSLLFAANLVAIVVTSMVVFLLVGMGRKAVRRRIDEWEDDPEHQTGWEMWVSRVRVLKWFSRVGSLKARLAVALVFLMFIYFPLHKALSRVIQQVAERTEREMNVKAINNLAKESFRKPGISELEKVTVEGAKPGLRAIVNISTNQIYTKRDKQLFETQATEQIGQEVRLVLIQSPGYFGEEKDTDWSKVFAREEKPKSEEVNFLVLYDRLENAIKQIWPHHKADLLKVEMHLAENAEERVVPAIQLTYLSSNDLSEEAKDILQAGLKQQLGFDPTVHFDFYPTHFGPFPLFRTGAILNEDEKTALVQIGQVLSRFPDLEVKVEFLDQWELPPRQARRYHFKEQLLEPFELELASKGVSSERIRIPTPEADPRAILLTLGKKPEPSESQPQVESQPSSESLPAEPTPQP